MSLCDKLRQGFQLDCESLTRKYYQQVVLVNRQDVNNKLIQVALIQGDNYTCRHRVSFDLKTGKTGFRFTGDEKSKVIYPSFDKTDNNGIPQYAHNINIIIAGIQESEKCLIKQLDYGDYFAAIQLYNGLVEIYGFEYGLSTKNYSYNIQSNSGGGILTLSSLADSLEDEPPFIYDGLISDFDNNFSDVIFNPSGDFNDDFNNDFNNQNP